MNQKQESLVPLEFEVLAGKELASPHGTSALPWLFVAYLSSIGFSVTGFSSSLAWALVWARERFTALTNSWATSAAPKGPEKGPSPLPASNTMVVFWCLS